MKVQKDQLDIIQYRGAILLFLLLLVCCILFSNDLFRVLEWDEAVYISQVNLNVKELYWHPARSRGIVWLISLISQLGYETLITRLFIFITYILTNLFIINLSKPVIGIRNSLLFVLLMNSYWAVQYYSIAISPNLLYSQFALLSLICITRLKLEKSNNLYLLLYIFIFLTINFRFYFSGLLFGFVSIWMLSSSSSKELKTHYFSACILGIIPWIYESFQKFKNPFYRIFGPEQHTYVEAPDINIYKRYIYALDGPIFPVARDINNGIDYVLLSYVVLLLVFGIILYLYIENKQKFKKTYLVLFIGLISQIFSLYFAEVAAPRYMFSSLAIFFYLFVILLSESSKNNFSPFFKFLFILGLAFLFKYNITLNATNQPPISESKAFYETITRINDKLESDYKNENVIISAQYGSPVWSVNMQGRPISRFRFENFDCNKYSSDTKHIIIFISGRQKFKEMLSMCDDIVIEEESIGIYEIVFL